MKTLPMVVSLVLLSTVRVVAQYVPDANTLGLWHLDEATGTSVADASAFQNNGITVGTNIVQGKFSKARQFFGNDHVEVPAINPAGSFTVEAWVRIDPPSGGEQWNPIVDHGAYDFTPKRGYLLTIHTDPDGSTGILFAANEATNAAGNTVFWVNTTNAQPPRLLTDYSVFHHVAGVWDGQVAKVYVDGEVWHEEAGNPNKTVASNSFPTLIGAMYVPGGKLFFRGVIDEVRISNVARTFSPPCTMSVSTCSDATVYYGYQPLSSTQLQASETGNTGTVSYSWSPATGLSNSQISTPIANPVTTTTYTVTAQDANGCTATEQVLVTVIDVRCGNRNDKVSLYHNGHSICISANAVPAHLAHGDVFALPMAKTGTIGTMDVPNQFSLKQNYPNPFNPSTTIEYDLPQRSQVEIRIFNSLGQLVRTLVNSQQDAGRYAITWNGESNEGGVVATGVYFYRLRSGEFVQTKKLVFLR
jgi:hypothetical protein